MKQRKTKQSQPKRVTLSENQQLPTTSVDNVNKQPSGHTKISTHYTIHSASQNIPQDLQNKKNKKSNVRNSK
jgi:hypothetical protein